MRKMRLWPWFQHRYAKLALDREEHLRQVLGVSLKVKKEVAETRPSSNRWSWPSEALGADNFASLFEVEQMLTPTKVFTETSCQLPSETRAALIVAIAAK